MCDASVCECSTHDVTYIAYMCVHAQCHDLSVKSQRAQNLITVNDDAIGGTRARHHEASSLLHRAENFNE